MTSNKPFETTCFSVVSIFPEMFEIIGKYGITGKAIRSGIAKLETFNPRDFATGQHKDIDDKPFGGGPGMLMMAEPIRAAIAAAKTASPQDSKVIYLTPQAQPIKQKDIHRLSQMSSLILLAGRYEGIDDRIIELDVDEQWSIGDYVLTGGELPVMVLMDAIIRLLPGALGNAKSLEAESFSNGLLGCPQFTRPRRIAHLEVPKVLLSGNHQAIERWQLKQAIGRTLHRRPDLLEGRELSQLEQRLLEEYLQQD